MLHVTAPVPSGWGTARVSTGCATPCRSRARHWQLAAGPGAGSGKARHKTDHKQAQICLLCRMPNQIAHDHLSTAGRVACVKVGWAPTLAAGRRPRRGESAKRVTKQTTNRRKSVSCAVCPTRCTRSPLHSWQSGLCQGRLGAHTGSWPQAQARGVGKARHETDHKQAQICLLCRMPNQLHTITSSQLPEWPVSRLVGRPHWQLAAGPGAVISKAHHKTDHSQAQICLLCRMPIQLHR